MASQPRDSSARAEPGEYSDSFPATDLVNPIHHAIATLLPGRIAKRDLLNLFDNRANYKAINAWRYGVCSAPQWAIDLLDTRHAERIAPHAKARELIRGKAGPGYTSDRNGSRLNAWRLKQKAGG